MEHREINRLEAHGLSTQVPCNLKGRTSLMLIMLQIKVFQKGNLKYHPKHTIFVEHFLEVILSQPCMFNLGLNEGPDLSVCIKCRFCSLSLPQAMQEGKEF